jgi:phenylacetate-CoA ligase
MNDNASALAGVLRQLEATQWQSPEALGALQRRQLGNLAAHAELHSPQFRARLRDAGLTGAELGLPGGLQRLPVLTRRLLKSAADVYCDTLPQGHGATYEARTSGSTGEPVTVRRTVVNGMDWMAATMRDHLWHRRDFLQPLCSIRADIPEVALFKDWGPPVNWLFNSGPLLGIPITTAIDRQIELIREFKPRILLLYPSNLAGIVSRGLPLPSVRRILTIGETLSRHTRDDACTFFDARIEDTYSSQELGIIAIQCPDSPLYHVMSENLIVEVLNADGTACHAGEVGRVVATDIRNFAMPLVRYDIGDYAEVGRPCACGRGLPTLSRILGRERNLILVPDGTRHWPYLGSIKMYEFAPIIQYQFIQDGPRSIELRLVLQRALTAEEESDLVARIQRALGFPFEVRFAYFPERIPAGASGKFEEFVCRVAV